MRIFSGALLLVALAACGSDEDGGFPGENKSGPAVERIACARGDAPLVTDCIIERTVEGDGELLVIHHADGGFRKLRQRGETVAAMDGAAPAAVQLTGGGLDVRVANDRYRLPLAR